MDLSSVKINLQSVPMRLENPITGVPMDGPEDIVLHVLPPQAPQVVEKANKLSEKFLNKKKAVTTADEINTASLEVLVASIEKWENVTLEGEALECTSANVRKILGDPELAWVREQVQAFVNDLQNFMKKA